METKEKPSRFLKTMPEHITTLTTADGKSQYLCIPCQKSFRSRSQKYYHYSCNNTDAKKHKCNECGKCFSTRSHLNYHVESHNTTKYQCQECQQIFLNRIVLQKHLKLHRIVLSFDCTHCAKKFRSKESLKAHTAKHDNNLSFQCNDCDKKYATKSALKQHKLKHLGKKHECTHCGKNFQRNSILVLHMKRHAMAEQFICTICDKKFSDSNALQRHTKVHKNDDVVKYQCQQCNITTARKDNMQRHVRNMHVGENFEDCVETIRPIVLSEKSESEIESITFAGLNLPKTIANSSVIKSVGNVEPIKVPDAVNSNQDSICPDERTFTVLQNSKPSKLMKEYDPIKMYRKILNSDEEDEQDDIQEAQKIVSHRRSSNITTSNFSEMHWRKNFKYTYQQGE